jgi:signal transduction histidine kinase
VVRVTDSGPGIPPEIQRRIFDPFFTTKGVGQGTGLGLDIVRRLIKQHDGEISVESAPGRTEFAVRVPLAQ